jgi:hypothetical protein
MRTDRPLKHPGPATTNGVIYAAPTRTSSCCTAGSGRERTPPRAEWMNAGLRIRRTACNQTDRLRVLSMGPRSPRAAAAPRSSAALRVTEPIRIDGRLDEEAWSRAVPVTDFTQVAGGGAPASGADGGAHPLRRGRALRRRADVRQPAAHHPAGAARRQPPLRLAHGDLRLVPRSPHRLRLRGEPVRGAPRPDARRRRTTPGTRSGRRHTSTTRVGRRRCVSPSASFASTR